MIKLLEKLKTTFKKPCIIVVVGKGSSFSVELISKMLKNDKLYNARISAALALYNIGDKSVLPVLQERAKSDENKTVRTVLLGIIKRMNS